MKKAFLLLTIFLAIHTQAFGIQNGPIVIAGTGNPAAILCDQVGGTLVMAEKASSETTLCSIGNALIEQWTLYSALQNQTPQQATQALLSSADCKAAAGTIMNAKNSETGQKIQLCEFPDKSLIELKTLKHGAQAEENEQLIALLLQAQKS